MKRRTKKVLPIVLNYTVFGEKYSDCLARVLAE